jgi:hypothetical protein
MKLREVMNMKSLRPNPDSKSTPSHPKSIVLPPRNWGRGQVDLRIGTN